MKDNLATKKTKLLAKLAEIKRAERAKIKSDVKKQRATQARADEDLGARIRAAAKDGNPDAVELIKLLEAKLEGTS